METRTKKERDKLTEKHFGELFLAIKKKKKKKSQVGVEDEVFGVGGA